MPATYIAFDVRSGQILSVHHGADNAEYVRERVQQRSKISREHVEVIAASAPFGEKGKRYKVDIARKALVEAEAGDRAVGFAFGHVAAFTTK